MSDDKRISVADADRVFIQEFANRHGLVFDANGEIGFGRPCVGLRHGDCFAYYNPYGAEELHDDRLYPPDSVGNAYHKDNCVAVLGSGDDAIRQLADWLRHYDEVGVEIYMRPLKHDNVIAAMLHGPVAATFRVKGA